jgi:hypothetical protein
MFCCRERNFDAPRRCDVHDDGLRLTFIRLDGLNGLIDRLGATRRDGYPCAAPDQKEGKMSAEPAGGACHKDVLALDRKQVAHLTASPLPCLKNNVP